MNLNEEVLRELEILQRINTATGQKLSELIAQMRGGQLSAVPPGKDGLTARGGQVSAPSDEKEFRAWSAASGSVDVNLYVQERDKVLEIARNLNPNVAQGFMAFWLRTASTDLTAFFASQAPGNMGAGPELHDVPSAAEELGQVERMLDHMAGAGPTEEADALAAVVGDSPAFANISLMLVNKLSPEINPIFKGFMKPGFKGLKVYKENVLAIPAPKLTSWPIGFYGSAGGAPTQFLVKTKTYLVILSDIGGQPNITLFSLAAGQPSAEMELQDLTHHEQAVLEAELRAVLDQYVH